MKYQQKRVAGKRWEKFHFHSWLGYFCKLNNEHVHRTYCIWRKETEKKLKNIQLFFLVFLIPNSVWYICWKCGKQICQTCVLIVIGGKVLGNFIETTFCSCKRFDIFAEFEINSNSPNNGHKRIEVEFVPNFKKRRFPV